MFGHKTLKRGLIGTTALIGAAMITTLSSSADAASITVNTTVGTQTLGATDTLTVTSTGTIQSSTTPDVVVNGVAANSVTVDAGGTMQGSGGTVTVFHVTGAGADLTGGILNNGFISATGPIVKVDNGGTISGDITNNNQFTTMTSSNAAAVVVTGSGSDISGVFRNNQDISSSADAAFLVESGGQMSGGINNADGQGISGIGAAIIVSGAGSDIGGIGVTNGTGPIEGTSAAVIVKSGGDISGGIHNNGGAIVATTTHTKAVIQVIGSSSDISGGIENSGKITGNKTAIGLASSGSVSGGISNSGTITGSSYGIFVGTGGSVGAGVYSGIVNSSTISGGSNAIRIVNGSITGGGDIKNTGLLKAAGGAAVLVTGSSASISGSIINDTGGVISASGSRGVFVTSSAAVTGSITNNGTITHASSGLALWNHATADSIQNTGLIKSTVKNGISVTNVNTLSGGVTNASGGTISATSNGIYLSTATLSGSGDVTNAGVITGAKKGVYIANGSSIGGDVTNSLGGAISNVSTGIFIKSSSVSGQVVNAGLIKPSKIGIELLSASLSQSISNSGTISGGTRGFFITNGTVGGNVVNTGNIKNDNTGIVINTGAVVTGDVRNDAGGTISAVNNTAIEVTGGTVGGNLSNGGIIMTASKGINLTASGKVSGDLSNSGTISASKIAINVVAGGTVTGDIKNSGTLSGGSTGISFQSAASSASSIQNSGTIKNEKIGIYLKTASSLSGGITNATGGVISASTADIDIRQSTVNGSITNNGTLSGASTGILFKSGSAATGIQNSGTISGGGHGIAVKNIGSATLTNGISNTSTGAITGVSSAGIYVKSASLTGGITNDGTLSGGDYGVYLLATSSVGGNLANNGTIENVSTGIRVYGGSSITGDLTNSGTISASTGGIVLNNSSIGGTISNSGTINVSGSYGIALSAGTTATSVQNSGTIENASTGLYVYNVNSLSGGITNTSTGVITGSLDGIKIANSTVNGAITNAAGGTVSGSNTGIHFALTNIINGAVSNSGLIKGGSYGINSSTPGATALKNGITNNAGGTISGGTTAIRLDGTNLYAAVSNSGTITGAKGIALNGTPLFFATPVIVNNAGGTISGTGGTAISINNISDPTPILVNGGSIIGDVTDTYHSLSGSSPVEIAANFTTQGNFTVSNFTVDSGKTLTIGSADTITADQGLTLTGATVNVGVDGTATFGKIVTGVAPDLSSTTITVNVAASPTLTDGDALKIIQGGGNITGGPGDVTPQSVTDNSLLWSFAIVEGNYNALSSDSDLYLVVNAAAGGCGGMTTTSGNNSACTVLQANSGTADPQLSQVIANVNGASTNQQLNNILSSTQPDVNGSGLQQTITVSDDALDINGTQLADLRDGSTGMAAGNGAAGGMNGLRGWLQTFGQASHQNARGGIAGYDGHTLGLAAGIDSGHNLDGKVVGFAFSYGHTMVGSDNANSTDTDIDSYQLSTYGSYDLPENSYVQGMAALAWNNLDTTRHNVGGGGGPTAKGSFSSRLFSLRGEYGRDFAFKGATVTPKLTGHWTFYNADSYTETGAGGADLHVHYKNYNILEIGPAIAARWKHKYADGSELVPQLSMAYRYDLIGDNIEASSSFTGGTGTVASVGPNPARGRLSLGAKATLLTADNWSLTADYDFDYKTDYTSHAGYLRAGYQF